MTYIKELKDPDIMIHGTMDKLMKSKIHIGDTVSMTVQDDTIYITLENGCWLEFPKNYPIEEYFSDKKWKRKQRLDSIL